MKYLLLFIGVASQPDATDSKTAAYDQKWGKYMATLAASGKMESGLPLQWSGKKVTRDGATDLVLEPVDIGGYLIVEAASIDEAVEIAAQAPHVALGGTTIVRPCDSIRGQGDAEG